MDIFGLSKIQIFKNMGERMFGKPKPPPTPPKEIPSLQDQIKFIEKRKEHLERLVEIYDQKAKLSKTKDEAIRNLKLKINYANEIKTIYGMIYNLEKLESARQKVELQKNMVHAAKQTTNIIRQNMIDPDDANDIIFETEEAIKDVEDVSRQLGRNDSYDEELQSELDKLFVAPVPQQLPQQQITTNNTVNVIPNNQIQHMEDELRALEA
jgi:hypothetical protein